MAIVKNIPTRCKFLKLAIRSL